MATVNIVLRKKENKDGTFPIAIRITKDRKSSFIHTGKSVNESEWDETSQRVKKNHPNSKRLNNFLLQKLADANDKMLEMETSNAGISSQAVRYSLKPSLHGDTFFSVAKSYIDNFEKAGKYNRFQTERSRINKFRTFLQGSDIAFQDINVPLLNRFSAYLQGKGLSERTVMNHWLVIRTIYNMAIKEGVVTNVHYPFGKDNIKIKFPDSLKIGLNPEEVKTLELFPLERDTYLHHVRNLWMFSFYFAGMRASDELRLRWSDFQNGRLFYKMGKNNKAGSLAVPAKAMAILSQYEAQKSSDEDLVFPELRALNDLENRFETERQISYAIKRIDENLQKLAKKVGIKKDLTMHIARHTFGNISEDKISPKMLQKLYRHSSLNTTIGYQSNFIHKDADAALDSVISF